MAKRLSKKRQDRLAFLGRRLSKTTPGLGESTKTTALERRFIELERLSNAAYNTIVNCQSRHDKYKAEMEEIATVLEQRRKEAEAEAAAKAKAKAEARAEAKAK